MRRTVISEKRLSPELVSSLIRMSADWEAEQSCHGYRKNEEADIEGNRIFVAEDGAKIVAYLFGHEEKSEREQSATVCQMKSQRN